MALTNSDWGYILDDRELGRPCFNSMSSSNPRCVHTCCVWVDTTAPRFDWPNHSAVRGHQYYCATCLVQGRVHR